MAERGLRYWLQWPHSRRDYAIATVVFATLALAMAVTDSFLAALVAAIVAVVLATKVVWWEARQDQTDGDAGRVEAGAGEASAGEASPDGAESGDGEEPG